MKETKNVFTNSILYTVGNLMLKAFSFFLIPLYTAYLSTEAYGVINLATGFFGVASALLTFSLSYAVTRFYADYREDKNMVAKMIGTTMTFVLVVCAVFVVLAMAAKGLVSRFFFSGLPFWPVVLLSILISVVFGLYSLYQEILKGMQEAAKSVIFSYVYFFLLLGSNIATVVWLKLGAEGVLWSNLLVNVVMVIIMLIDLLHRRLMVFGIDIKMLGKLLRYSVPLIPHTVAYNISNYATKLIISSKLSFSMLGIFSLASQFGAVADVVLNSVQSAFQPWMFGVLNTKKEENKTQLIRNTYTLMWIYGFLFLGLSCFSQEVVLLIADESYAAAWTYIPAVVIAISLKSPLYFYTGYLYYDVAKTKYVFVSTLVGCAINIVMTWILVPYLQVYGSILADVIAMIARLAVVMRFLPKEGRELFSIKKLTLYSVMPIVFIVVALVPSYTLYPDLSLINFAYKVLIVLVYLAIALLCNRTVVKSVAQRILKKDKKSGSA